MAGIASGGEDPVAEARRAADVALARHDPVSAEVLLRTAIQQHHADAALRAWLAEALLAEGDVHGARTAIDAGPISPDGAGLGWRVKGQVALAEGRLGDAGAAFDEALKLMPGDADLWVAIASLRFTGGEQALSVEAADRAVALGPKNPRALALRGLLIREQFGLAASLPWFEAALKAQPDEPALLDAYGTTLGDIGDYRAMLTVARKLAEVDPKSQRPRLMEAVLAARAGEVELARSILQRTGNAFRDMPAVMLLSGVLEYQAGNPDVAVEQFERLVRIQPDNAMARHCLARALAAKGDWRRITDLFDGDVAAGRADADLARLVGTAWLRLAAREGGGVAKADRAKGEAIVHAAANAPGRLAPAPLASEGMLSVLAAHYGDNPHLATNAVPYIRALLANRQNDAAQDVADRLRDENSGNADANMLAGDVRMLRGDARAALIDYTNAAAIRFNEAVLVRMDAALRAAGRAGDADGMTSRYLAQNPQSMTAMTLLAAGWARNPARAKDLDALRKAMLARGGVLPISAQPNSGSTSAAKPG